MKALAILAGALWVGCVLLLLGADPASAYGSLGAAAYAGLLALVTWWLIPKTPERENHAFLRASGPQPMLVLRYIVVAASVLSIIGLNIFAASGIHVTPFWQWQALFAHLQITRFIEGHALQNAASEALIPGILLFALGATALQLGLTRPAKGTGRAIAACLALPAVFVVLALIHHRISLEAILLSLVVRNLLSNGFSEEFIMRGVLFSHLRAMMRTPLALYVQAAIFALLHFGIGEEHGNTLLILASAFALNFPVGLMLGFMALRSRSLLLPSIVHMSLNAMKDLVIS